MNLKDHTRWKVTMEENEYVIRGKRGVITQYEDGSLNVWITNRWVAQYVQTIFKPLHTYDDGADFNVDNTPHNLEKCCRWIKAPKRRRNNPETQKRLSEWLTRWRFKKKAAPVEGHQRPLNPADGT